MNSFRWVWRQWVQRPGASLVSLLLVLLGSGLMLFLAQVQRQAEAFLGSDLRGIDLVVGAKGSPLQLTLANVYHLDNPTGNIPARTADSLCGHPMVRRCIPLAYGDNYAGFRIVGSDTAFLAHYALETAEGGPWQGPMDALLGAEAAARTGLRPGDSFLSIHGQQREGEQHEGQPFRVCGILKSSGRVPDRLILTQVEAIHAVHTHEGEEEEEEEEELTAVLIQLKNKSMFMRLLPEINEGTALQAAAPFLEIRRLTDSLLPVAVKTLAGLAWAILAVSALSLFLMLYARMRERRYELALIRSLGASPLRVAGLVLAEGLSLALAGLLGGLLAARGGLLALTFWADPEQKYRLNPFAPLSWEEIGLSLAIIGIGCLAALIPAAQAFRLDISRTLTDA
jgi:putative ABC transport system permease protein